MAMDYSYRRNKLINIYNECGLFADAFVNLSLRYLNRLTGNQLLLRIKKGVHKSDKVLLKYTTEKSRASSHKDKGPKNHNKKTQ